MKSFLLLSLFLFISCVPKNKNDSPIDTPKNPVGNNYTELELDASEHLFQYADSFIARMELAEKDTSANLTRLNRTSIRFGSAFDRYVIGTCTVYSNGNRLVEINPDFWYGKGLWSSPAHSSSREQLMYHELGHCVLNRDHLNTTTAGKADSLMNSYHLNFSLYLSNYVMYLKELFWLTATPPFDYVADLNLNGFNQGPYVYSSEVESFSSSIASIHSTQGGDCQFHKDIEE